MGIDLVLEHFQLHPFVVQLVKQGGVYPLVDAADHGVVILHQGADLRLAHVLGDAHGVQVPLPCQAHAGNHPLQRLDDLLGHEDAEQHRQHQHHREDHNQVLNPLENHLVQRVQGGILHQHPACFPVAHSRKEVAASLNGDLPGAGARKQLSRFLPQAGQVPLFPQYAGAQAAVGGIVQKAPILPQHTEEADGVLCVGTVKLGCDARVAHIHTEGAHIGAEIVQALHHGNHLLGRLLDHFLMDAGEIGFIGVLFPGDLLQDTLHILAILLRIRHNAAIGVAILVDNAAPDYKAVVAEGMVQRVAQVGVILKALDGALLRGVRQQNAAQFPIGIMNEIDAVQWGKQQVHVQVDLVVELLYILDVGIHRLAHRVAVNEQAGEQQQDQQHQVSQQNFTPK